MTKVGRLAIVESYSKNPDYLQEFSNNHLTCLLKESEKLLEDPHLTSGSTNATKKKGTLKSVAGRDPNYGLKLDKCNLFNSYNVALEKF
jgi:hypothetical protein